MTLDFNTDIAPLRQQFFPMLAGQQAFDRSMQYYQSTIAPMQDRLLGVQRQMLDMQTSQLAYERQQFELEQARRKAQAQVDVEQKMPEINERLDAILNDPATDMVTKSQQLGGLSRQYATSITTNPAVASIFSSAAGQLNVLQKKESEAQSRKQGLMASAAQIGGVETVRNLAESDGEVDEIEQGYLDIGQQYLQRQEQESAFKGAERTQEQQEKTARQQLERLKGFESYIRKVGEVDDADMFAAILRESRTGQKVEMPKKFKLTNKDRIDLEEIMINLNPTLTREFVGSVDAEDLYRAVIGSIQKEKTRLTPIDPDLPKATSGFFE